VTTRIIANRATGYQPAFDDQRACATPPAYDKTILTGSGSLYSTTADLYEWLPRGRGQQVL